MMEVESNSRSTFEKTSQFSARALVLKTQHDCLVGLGGSIIKEMVNATGARIQILDDTDVPDCASSFELVVQASFPPLKQKHYKYMQFGSTCLFYAM
jgi:poly(rC)-binding protein 2/3/4